MRAFRIPQVLVLSIASIFFISVAYGQPTEGKVSQVVDGDTFVLSSGETVRLAGIDAPESKHPTKPVAYYSQQAREYLGILLEGKTVTLEYSGDIKDKYGRLLAFVYLEDGTFVNAEMVKTGHAMAYLKYPCDKEPELLEYELAARRLGIGMWGSSPIPQVSSPEPVEVEKAPKATVKPEVDSKKYWINSGSMKRHNRSCRWYGNTKNGYFTGEKVGSACGICGG